jgi:hypothetical protein
MFLVIMTVPSAMRWQIAWGDSSSSLATIRISSVIRPLLAASICVVNQKPPKT